MVLASSVFLSEIYLALFRHCIHLALCICVCVLYTALPDSSHQYLAGSCFHRLWASANLTRSNVVLFTLQTNTERKARFFLELITKSLTSLSLKNYPSYCHCPFQSIFFRQGRQVFISHRNDKTILLILPLLI